MNRAARRAAVRAKSTRARPLPRVPTMVLAADFMPRMPQERILGMKIALLEGIAALKDGSMTYELLANLHDFLALALAYAAHFNNADLRQPAEACAVALTAIMERYSARGYYIATGDELRTLQEWVEAIADCLAESPAGVLEALATDLAAAELSMRMRQG